MIEKDSKYYLKKILLFVVTFICTTLAGGEWATGKYIFYSPDYAWADFAAGFAYSVPFLLILGVHEFGHFFTAKYHKVEVTLPNFIPGWLGFMGTFSFGTFGALIRIIGPIRSRKQYFDIGIAGPIAGFVVALGVLWYGFATLPPHEYIFQVHPEYEQYGLDYADHVYNDPEQESIVLGNNILFWLFEEYVADPERLPNHREIMHYPILLAGFLSLFFTALNLLPIGQLDGGHIIYGIFGAKKHQWIATTLYFLLAYVAGLGLITVETSLDSLPWTSILYVGFLFICFKGLNYSFKTTIILALSVFVAQYLTSIISRDFSGFQGYLLFVFILGRFIGVKHPVTADETPLSTQRKVLGWIALLIFVLCFSFNPFVIE
ncbi:site-2 protease family protein [Marivirga sp. S37H4]|uniref:Site-2 protease family protein n=1 Tax=Marivirga aurantiaca TaxID=2802615 RepID=A0A935C9W6_9BACT|nr:site-2 protease family protein [Marivirga aurantiaca]MBK6266214.1 site-2 protease family protein [Marivirga aurantiaca]